MLLQEIIAKALSKATDLNENEVLSLVEFPAKRDFGTLSVPCFQLASSLKKKPEAIALDLKEKIKDKAIERVQAVGPYLNFSFDANFLIENFFTEIIASEKIPSLDLGKKEKVMVEFSQPNPNKPMHLGHLRNDCIGMSLSNMLSFCNYNVIKANLINDRGIHICQMMLAYKLFGENKKPADLKMKEDHFIGYFYVLFQQKLKENPSLNAQAQELLRLWEKKDKKTIKLWRKLRNYAINGFKKTYQVFGSKFDVWFFESNFYDKGKSLINEGLKKGVFFKDSDNSIKVKLSHHGLPDKTVLRADGTSIYFTNDLILTKYKFEHFKLKHAVWVVASEQDLYFKQLFKTFELFSFPWAKNCEHLSYGLVLLPGGKMKSREGIIVDADDLIVELKESAKKELVKRNALLKGKELDFKAEKIALSAIKFFLLMHDLKKDFIFKPEESLSFEGNTGPYLLYTYARAKSILRNAGTLNKKAIMTDLKNAVFEEPEKKLLRTLALFNDKVKYCVERRAIHLFAEYLLDLASDFNSFYNSLQVLKANKSTRNARLGIVLLFSIFLKQGLSLLNIDVLDSM